MSKFSRSYLVGKLVSFFKSTNTNIGKTIKKKQETIDDWSQKN